MWFSWFKANWVFLVILGVNLCCQEIGLEKGKSFWECPYQGPVLDFYWRKKSVLDHFQSYSLRFLQKANLKEYTTLLATVFEKRNVLY